MAPTPFTAPPGFDPETDSEYHYVPTAWVCLVFVSLYGVSTLVHLVEAISFKMWWLLPTATLAGIGEVLGWVARYWSSQDDGTVQTPFLMQISTTIIAPTPLLAAYFILLGRLIILIGPQYSRLKQKQYIIVFTTADFVALVVQAAGGGIASSATDPTNGGHIMLAGIAFQLVSLSLFVCLAIEFMTRLYLDRPFNRETDSMELKNFRPSSESLSLVDPDIKKPQKRPMDRLSPKLRLLLAGMAFSTTCLFIRAIYRLIELADGWNGRIISTQVYFNVLDGGMVLLAISTLNVLHPGFLLT